MTRFRPVCFAACVLTVALARPALRAADFSVVASFPTFTINGQGNPTLTLQRGSTYTFAGGSSSHPFYIKSVQGNGTGNAFTNGVTGNGLTGGTLIFVVPPSAPNQLFFNCAIHGSMTGIINIIDPPTPPPFQIVGLSAGTNLTLRHTGTNTFTYAPEFSTNLITTNWFALTVQSNFFANGTYEVICGLPPGTNVFLRVRAQ